MTIDDFNEIATKGDLEKFRQDLLSDFQKLLSNGQKEFYTPREFSEVTGLKYDLVVKRCREGSLPAHQPYKNASWLIPRAEIDKIREGAYKWIRKKDLVNNF